MNNFLYYKTNTNTLSGYVDYLGVNETTKYNMVSSLPTNPESGMVVYYQNDLKLYDGTQWVTLANSNTNETFNNLTVTSSLYVSGTSTFNGAVTMNSSLSVNNLSIYGYNIPKQASITYKIEKVGGSWFLGYYGSSQLNGLALDISNVSANYRTGIVVLNKSLCGINNILDFSVKMTYCDDPNTCLQVRPATLLFSSLIPTPTPAPDVITLYTYVYDQFRVINDLDVDSRGSVFIFTVNLFGY